MNKFGLIWLAQFSQIWSIYVKKAIFSTKGDFPYILQYRVQERAFKRKSNNNWETYDPISERRKMGLQHISK